ncbi:Arm DNA-binding domain-containing protein [Brevundimonas vesicularis]|uniref:Arm DNA-binding domain-containing protein n=1 Tax=Brevundimonas vesicularis TaxID=41276 RepID=UPI003F8DEF24
MDQHIDLEGKYRSCIGQIRTCLDRGVFTVLTDVALKNLRPQSKPYKSTDRDGLYVYVSPGGAISFRYDYRFNGRRETLTLGRYGRGGLSLAHRR